MFGLRQLVLGQFLVLARKTFEKDVKLMFL
jgi:hypothetical protein